MRFQNSCSIMNVHGTIVGECPGVAATSASNAWAAGGYSPSSSAPAKTLILRWNGTRWK